MFELDRNAWCLWVVRLLVCVAASSTAAATSYTFTANGNASGDWGDQQNWSPSTGYPIVGDTATIPNGKTCLVEQANQRCLTVTVNSGGILLVKGRNLTIDSGMQINGDLQLKEVSNVLGRIYFESDIQLSGSGKVDARVANGLGRGEFLGSGSAYVYIGSSLSVVGSLNFYCWVTNDGTIETDGSDVMNIGPTSGSTIAVDGATGVFAASGEREITFNRASLSYGGLDWPRKLWVKEGTIRLTSNCVCTNGKWSVLIDGGGKFIVETNAAFAKPLTFSCGTIRLAPEVTLVFTP
ncbi:hypothetical protein RAS1_38860 [Phycisphaerae bacterium RAS1]|nr:hypothetical protein RAS1_38860 [Phycisphaerae bacterium RAS1]